jgi:hypothetical protein
MFNWLIKKTQNIRIDFAYPAYEATAKAAYVALANSRFSTKELAAEIESLMTIPRQEAFTLYQAPITKLSLSISTMSGELSDCRVNLSFFSRSYKDELDPLYALIDQFKVERKVLYSDKDDAYEDLNKAKKEIESWHSRSQRTYFFGNGGKELPRHSLFGQSFGDLDAYKADRAEASEEIQSCNCEIGRLKGQMTTACTQINSIKVDRQHMYDLRKQGLNAGNLKKTLLETERQIGRLQADLKQLEAQRVSFFEAARYRLGVVAREAEIARIVLLKNNFLSIFEEPQAKSARKLAHRIAWLRNH